MAAYRRTWAVVGHVASYAVLTVAGVLFARRSDTADWFLAVWLGGMAWTWYLVLTSAWSLEIDGAVLAWRTLVARGEVPCHEVRSVRHSRLGNVTVIETAGRPLKVMSGRGLAAFLAQLPAR